LGEEPIERLPQPKVPGRAAAQVANRRDNLVTSSGSPLSRPEPPKRSRRQQSINKPVEHVFKSHSPGFALPDRILHQRHRVSQESRCSRDAEDLEILRAGHSCASCQISGEDADHYAVKKPLCKKPSHGRSSSWSHRKHADGPALKLFNYLR